MEVHSGIYICNAIVSTVDYGLLLAAKLIGRADNPFTLQIGGIRILLVVWLVKLVILGLLLAEIEYNPANAVRMYITNHTAASRLGGYRITQKCGRCHRLVQDTTSSEYPVSGY